MKQPAPALPIDLTDKPAAPVNVSPEGVRIYSSKTLMQDGQMVWIEHEGEIYRLQATRLGKLILTK